MANPQQMQGQPIFILSPDAQRSLGRDAQRNNIAAAKAVGDTVRTTLGPKGMDKMLVDSIGDIVITNDGVTILEEMEIEHPAAKMLVEVAKTQDEEVGDGTTTAVVIASELLKKAETLLEQEIHPTVITKGYKIARERALQFLEDKIAKKLDIKDREMLRNIASTSMTGKTSERASAHLSEVAIDAVLAVRDENGQIDLDNIQIEKKQGKGVEDTELIKGIVIDKEVVHTGMPKLVDNAKIALLDAALEVKETETDAEIRITSPDQLEAFLEKEENMLKGMVEKIKESGANVVFCQKGIDDVAQHHLAKAGIAAARRVKKSDMDKLARATGARVVTSINDLTKSDLGYAKKVEEQKIAGEEMIFVRDCKSPKAVSILIRGGTEHVVDEIQRGFDDALGALSSAIEDGFVVAGGGAPEEAVANDLKKYAQKFSGREQLAILAFADALEVIPRTLAENAGLDPIDMLVELRAAHETNKVTSGLDVFKGKVVDMWKQGVIEPLRTKKQAIKSASEAAELILRIDDVVAASKLSKGPAMPPGGMGDMGDMGGD